MKCDWATKQLREVCTFVNGDRGENYPSKSHRSVHGIPFINAGHLRDGAVSFDEMDYIPRDRFELLGSGKIQRGDLLFCLRGSLGKSSSVGDLTEGAIASSLVIVRPKESMLPRFVLAYLHSDMCTALINRFKNGAAQPNLSAQNLANFTIPVPPLEEQQRIVGILDQAFAAIATAKAYAEKNLQNARTLYGQYLSSILAARADGWQEKKLGEIAESISTGPFGTMLHKADYVSSGVPVVNPMNIINSNIVPLDRMMVSHETRDRLSSYVLREGDIVIGRRGELGRCALVTSAEAGWLCGTGSFILRLKSTVDPLFFVSMFSSDQFKARLLNDSVGTTMNSLNNSILSDLPVLLPPLEVQRAIMTKVSKMKMETQKLEDIYVKKQMTLELLKSSILHSAFDGAL